MYDKWGLFPLREYWEFIKFYVKTSQGWQETIKAAERLYNCFCILKKKVLSYSNYEKENIKLQYGNEVRAKFSATNWYPIEHRIVITLKSRRIIWKHIRAKYINPYCEHNELSLNIYIYI